MAHPINEFLSKQERERMYQSGEPLSKEDIQPGIFIAKGSTIRFVTDVHSESETFGNRDRMAKLGYGYRISVTRLAAGFRDVSDLCYHRLAEMKN